MCLRCIGVIHVRIELPYHGGSPFRHLDTEMRYGPPVFEGEPAALRESASGRLALCR